MIIIDDNIFGLKLFKEYEQGTGYEKVWLLKRNW